MEKEKINNWLQRLIDAKTTVITLLGITTNETVLNVFWDEWSVLEGKLKQYNIDTFGKSIPDIKKLIIPTLLMLFSCCQTVERQPSESKIIAQVEIDTQAKRDRREAAQTAGEYLIVLRGYTQESKIDPDYKRLAQTLLLKIKTLNKIHNLGIEPQIEDSENSLNNQ